VAGIKILNLNKSKGGYKLLTNFCLLVKSGEFVMISGGPKSGKSTLLKIIAGFESYPSGDVFLDTQNLNLLSSAKRAELLQKTMGFIPQGFFLEPSLTIRENIALPGIFAKLPDGKLKERTETVAKILGVAELLDKKPKSLPPGSALQRICIARALLLDPPMLLLDEPTDSLDGPNADTVLKIVKLFQEKLGKTVLVATADSRVEPYATKIVDMKGVVK